MILARWTSLPVVAALLWIGMTAPAAARVSSQPAASPKGLVVEAESPGNVLRGASKVFRCTSCSGGKLVRFIGYGGSLNMAFTVPKAGNYILRIAYTDYGPPRRAFIRVNFNVPTLVFFTSTGGWKRVGRHDFPAHLDRGLNHLAFTNPTSWCPDIDAVTVLPAAG